MSGSTAIPSPLPALGARPLFQAMKELDEKDHGLFHKRPYNHPGLDIYRPCGAHGWNPATAACSRSVWIRSGRPIRRSASVWREKRTARIACSVWRKPFLSGAQPVGPKPNVPGPKPASPTRRKCSPCAKPGRTCASPGARGLSGLAGERGSGPAPGAGRRSAGAGLRTRRRHCGGIACCPLSGVRRPTRGEAGATRCTRAQPSTAHQRPETVAFPGAGAAGLCFAVKPVPATVLSRIRQRY